MDTSAPPSLRRRLASMLYESMLLFAVVFIAGMVFSVVMNQRNALYLRHYQTAWLFLILGLYFVWFWTHSGQTLAMKTWRIRLVTHDGNMLSARRAICRYFLGWLWVFPGLALASMMGARGWTLVIVPGVNLLLWAATIYLDPKRQFLHDRIAGTRIVSVTSVAPEFVKAGK